MKKTIDIIIGTIALIGVLGAISVAKGQTPLPWTNGVAIYTNLNVGQVTIPLSSNAFFALQWQADQYNAQQNLTGTNRFKVKDMVAAATWFGCEGAGSTLVAAWQAWLQQQEDVSADKVAIRQQLKDPAITQSQLNQIKAILGIP